MGVQGLIIPRSYNDYLNLSDIKKVEKAMRYTGLIPEQATAENKLADKNFVTENIENYAVNKNDSDAIKLAMDSTGIIPATASNENKLADKDFVNSSISTNTAHFLGTFESIEALEAYSGEKTNNDYAFIVALDDAGNTQYKRYKYDGGQWVFEYTLNNSSFTAEQWASINSGITAEQVAQFNQQTSIQAIFDALHPMGECYVQYPQQKTPNELWSAFSTWEIVNYEGAFFRAEGGNANVFNGQLQSEGLPNITGLIKANGYSIGCNSECQNEGALKGGDFNKKSAGGVAQSSDYMSSISIDASLANSIYGSSEHVTPENYTIRIWKRIG